MEIGSMSGTPFHLSTAARTNSTWWYSWGGYLVPDIYTDLYTELGAIRNGAAMNEMSPIPKTEIKGSDAQLFVDYLFPRDISKMRVGWAWYAPCCTDDGMVVADGIIFRFGEDRFVFAADNCTKYFSERSESFDVSVNDVTDEYGILALQGPHSMEVLGEATGEDWSDLEFAQIRTTNIAGACVNVARQGFTGELGFELWVDRPDGQDVWESVASAGASVGVQPAGEYAIDVARVEAGLLLISAEYSGASTEEPSADVPPNLVDHVTPYELNLGHCIKLGKESDFIGRTALAAELAAGPSRRLTGLEFDAPHIVRLALNAGRSPDLSPRVRWDHLPLRLKGEIVGRASSVTWSPTTSRLIGFGMLPTELANPGTELVVDWADYWGCALGSAPVTTCEYPFIELGSRP